MIRRILEENKYLAILVTTLICASTLGYLDIKRFNNKINEHEERARYVAMYRYKPIGNGGALAEINGKVTLERQEMYNQIQDTYKLKSVGESPTRVREEYAILSNTNLSELEKAHQVKGIRKEYNIDF